MSADVDIVNTVLTRGSVSAGRNRAAITCRVLSLRMVGARPPRILLAYGVLPSFLAAWIRDTATTAMLVPIGDVPSP